MILGGYTNAGASSRSVVLSDGTGAVKMAWFGGSNNATLTLDRVEPALLENGTFAGAPVTSSRPGPHTTVSKPGMRVGWGCR